MATRRTTEYAFPSSKQNIDIVQRALYLMAESIIGAHRSDAKRFSPFTLARLSLVNFILQIGRDKSRVLNEEEEKRDFCSLHKASPEGQSGRQFHVAL